MKKNNKGFFLAETIVVLALVTTTMAFIYPNVSKLYDNYNSRIKYYDQTQDILLLKEIYNAYKDKIEEKTYGCCGKNEITNETSCNSSGEGSWMVGTKKIDNITEVTDIDTSDISDFMIKKLYIIGYMENPSDSNYNFNRYLKRMRKVTNDTHSYRLIGVFGDDSNERYASIKITTDVFCGIN